VTVTDAEALPPGPVTVIVKVVVCCGLMVKNPLGETFPMPGSMVAVVALVEVQESVVEAPAIMVCGLAPSVTVGGGSTVRVALALAVPPRPVAVRI